MEQEYEYYLKEGLLKTNFIIHHESLMKRPTV